MCLGVCVRSDLPSGKCKISNSSAKPPRHPPSLSVFIRPYAISSRWWRAKSRKTHTSAKLLRRLLPKRCYNLEATRHIAGPPPSLACCALPARAAIWQVSCTVSTSASAAFSSCLSLLELRDATSLSLPLRLDLPLLLSHFILPLSAGTSLPLTPRLPTPGQQHQNKRKA